MSSNFCNAENVKLTFGNWNHSVCNRLIICVNIINMIKISLISSQFGYMRCKHSFKYGLLNDRRYIYKWMFISVYVHVLYSIQLVQYINIYQPNQQICCQLKRLAFWQYHIQFLCCRSQCGSSQDLLVPKWRPQ